MPTNPALAEMLRTDARNHERMATYFGERHVHIAAAKHWELARDAWRAAGDDEQADAAAGLAKAEHKLHRPSPKPNVSGLVD